MVKKDLAHSKCPVFVEWMDGNQGEKPHLKISVSNNIHIVIYAFMMLWTSYILPSRVAFKMIKQMQYFITS